LKKNYTIEDLEHDLKEQKIQSNETNDSSPTDRQKKNDTDHSDGNTKRSRAYSDENGSRDHLKHKHDEKYRKYGDHRKDCPFDLTNMVRQSTIFTHSYY
jgi:hypothetical protein